VVSKAIITKDTKVHEGSQEPGLYVSSPLREKIETMLLFDLYRV
jgi:hypothetical protein